MVLSSGPSLPSTSPVLRRSTVRHSNKTGRRRDPGRRRIGSEGRMRKGWWGRSRDAGENDLFRAAEARLFNDPLRTSTVLGHLVDSHCDPHRLALTGRRHSLTGWESVRYYLLSGEDIFEFVRVIGGPASQIGRPGWANCAIEDGDRLHRPQ